MRTAASAPIASRPAVNPPRSTVRPTLHPEAERSSRSVTAPGTSPVPRDGGLVSSSTGGSTLLVQVASRQWNVHPTVSSRSG